MLHAKLGYLVFGVRHAARWHSFLGGMLGLAGPLENPDGSQGYRLDGAVQRLVITRGADDIEALGLELPSARDVTDLAASVAASGVAVTPASETLRASRHVERLVCFDDPAGNRVEVFVALQSATSAFESQLFPAGFTTGDLGIGHAGLIARDLAKMERFYVDVLGFGVSERLTSRVGPFTIRGLFLHCNRRHHSIALLDVPSRKRLHHFMLQAAALDDVGHAFERARRRRIPLSLGLGQHPHPDGTFSFYAESPSGFDFEIGASCGEIDPVQWVAANTTRGSSWGHAPTMRLKLKTVGALLANQLSRLE